jgi:hypothetical protein
MVKFCLTKGRLIALTVCSLLLLAAGLQASAYVRETVTKYDGACGKLTGLPGVLQDIGMLQFQQHPACAVVAPHNACASPGLVCGGTAPHERRCTDTVAAGCVCQ